MHINVIPNRGAAPTILLRESFRDGTKVCKRTLANLSALSAAQVQMIRGALRGDVLQAVEKTFEVIASPAHGHVQAVFLAMQRLGFASVLASKPSRERDLVLAMVASRIICPATKLATTRLWGVSTLAQEFGVNGAGEDELYASMTSGPSKPTSYSESKRLAQGTRPQVNYGLLTDDRGCPVAISVYEGNTSDSTTFVPQVKRLREEFGIHSMVMVGDRGMISQKAIDEMSKDTDVAWITALRSSSIRTLVEQGHLQMGLFDERNLLEISSPDFPGERLVACRNPELAKLRVHTRNDLLLATEKELEKIKLRVESAKLVGKDKIGVAAGKVVNRYKVSKHFELTITDDALSFARLQDSIAAEAALDGLYIIRTSVQAQRMDAPTCVRTYKSLAQVERAFRSIKTMDLKVRPIHHHLENRVRAHIFLCMLAYYGAPVHSFQTLMATLAGIVRNTCRTPSGRADAPTFEITTTPNPQQKRAMELIGQIKM